MKRIVFVLLLFLLPSGLCYAGSSIDGTWKVKYRVCLYYNDALYDCDKGNSNYIVSDNELYYGVSKVGTAKKSGNKVTFEYDYEYMKTSYEAAFQSAGAEVTVQEASLSFSGTLRKNTIKNGKIKGTIVLVFESTGNVQPTPPPPKRGFGTNVLVFESTGNGGGGKKSKIEPLEAEPSATPEPRVTPEPGVTYTLEFSGKFTAKRLKKGNTLKELHNTEEHYSDIINAFDYSKLHQ